MTAAPLIITPSTCCQNGWRVTIWCPKCRVGRTLRTLGDGSWRLHWDRAMTSIWERPGLKCGTCGTRASRLDVAREIGRGGQFQRLLVLEREKPPA